MRREMTRMIDWLVWALIAYALSITLRVYELEPQVQVVLWKLGNVTVAAYVGYWVDRRAFLNRLEPSSAGLAHVRRAIIIAAAMLAVGMGL